MRALLAYWVDTLDPFLIRFHGEFGIRWYGLAYVAGFLVAAWLLRRYALAGRSLLSAAAVGDFMVALVVGVIVGGRVGSFLLYDYWKELATDPLAILRVWQGGMASHGGIVGVGLATLWFSRYRKIPFRHLWDLVASTAPAGLFFGRVANFINGELWGKPSDVPWAVIFPGAPPTGSRRSRAIPRSSTRRAWRACSFSPICSGASGKPMSSAPIPDAWPGNS